MGGAGVQGVELGQLVLPRRIGRFQELGRFEELFGSRPVMQQAKPGGIAQDDWVLWVIVCLLYPERSGLGIGLAIQKRIQAAMRAQVHFRMMLDQPEGVALAGLASGPGGRLLPPIIAKQLTAGREVFRLLRQPGFQCLGFFSPETLSFRISSISRKELRGRNPLSAFHKP